MMDERTYRRMMYHFAGAALLQQQQASGVVPPVPASSWRAPVLAAFDSVEGAGGGAITTALTANAAPGYVQMTQTGAGTRTFALRVGQIATASSALVYISFTTATGLNTTTPVTIRTSNDQVADYASVTTWNSTAWTLDGATYTDLAAGTAKWQGRGQGFYLNTENAPAWVEIAVTAVSGAPTWQVGVYNMATANPDLWFVSGMSITIQSAVVDSLRSTIQAAFPSRDPCLMIGARSGAAPADMVTSQLTPFLAAHPRCQYVWCDTGPNNHITSAGALPRGSGSTWTAARDAFRNGVAGTNPAVGGAAGSSAGIIPTVGSRWLYIPSLTFNNTSSGYNATGNPPVLYDTTPANGLLPVIEQDLVPALQAAPSTVLWNRSDLNLPAMDGYTTTLFLRQAFHNQPRQVQMTMSAVPTANATLTLGATWTQGMVGGAAITITFVASAPTGNQVLIGADATATMANLLTFLQGSADPDISQFWYTLAPHNATIIEALQRTDGSNKNSPEYVWSASSSPASNITFTGLGGSGDGVHPTNGAAGAIYRERSILPAFRHAYSGTGDWGRHVLDDWCRFFEPATGQNGGIPSRVKTWMSYAATQFPSTLTTTAARTTLASRISALSTTWTPPANGPATLSPTWHFVASDGATLDVSGNFGVEEWRSRVNAAHLVRNRTGSFNRMPTWTPALAGAGRGAGLTRFSLTATGYWMDAPSGSALPALHNSAADFTFGFWYRPLSTANIVLFAVQSGTTVVLSIEQLVGGQTIRMLVGATTILTETGSGASTTQPSFFCITRSGTTVTMYRDGTAQGTATYGTAIGTSDRFHIATKIPGTGPVGFVGDYYEAFGIIGTAISAGQVSTLRTYGQSYYGAV